jgi:hypothetical protein
MIISRSRGFIFVHVHKTADEAVTLALLPYLGPDDLVLGGTRAGNLRNLYWRRRHDLTKPAVLTASASSSAPNSGSAPPPSPSCATRSTGCVALPLLRAHGGAPAAAQPAPRLHAARP